MKHGISAQTAIGVVGSRVGRIDGKQVRSSGRRLPVAFGFGLALALVWELAWVLGQKRREELLQQKYRRMDHSPVPLRLLSPLQPPQPLHHSVSWCPA